MRTTTIILALALVASGCFDTEDEAGGGGSTTVAVAAPATAPASTDPVAPATTAAASGAGGGAEPTATTAAAPVTTAPVTTPVTDPLTDSVADCLVGEWVVTQDEMNAFYDAVEANIDGPGDLNFDIVGQAYLTLTDTEYEWHPAFDLSLTVAGNEGSGVAGGSISGTYTADGGIIVTTLGSSDMTMTITINGATMDASELGNSFISGVPINDAPYSCASGVPVIDFGTGDGTPRHPVTLTPAG